MKLISQFPLFRYMFFIKVLTEKVVAVKVIHCTLVDCDWRIDIRNHTRHGWNEDDYPDEDGAPVEPMSIVVAPFWRERIKCGQLDFLHSTISEMMLCGPSNIPVCGGRSSQLSWCLSTEPGTQKRNSWRQWRLTTCCRRAKVEQPKTKQHIARRPTRY